MPRNYNGQQIIVVTFHSNGAWILIPRNVKDYISIGKHQYTDSYSMKNSKGERYQIQKVIEEDLGVIIDTKLKFDSHISSKINKANQNLGIINRSFTYTVESLYLEVRGTFRKTSSYRKFDV